MLDETDYVAIAWGSVDYFTSFIRVIRNDCVGTSGSKSKYCAFQPKDPFSNLGTILSFATTYPPLSSCAGLTASTQS